MRLIFALVCALALAGCVDSVPTAVTPETTVIQGHVFDGSLNPVAGALVALGGSNATTTTDGVGGFQLEFEDRPEVAVLEVAAPGFFERKHIVAIENGVFRFNATITLDRVPVVVPFHETQHWEGNLACTWFAQAEHSHGGPGDPGSHNANDCSQETNDEVWVTQLKPGVRNAVIELQWTGNTLLSERLAIFVEGPGMDNGADALFFFNEGTSTLRANIGQLQASTHYDEGGPVRITVKIGAPEDDVAAGIAINQSFDVFLSAFYVLPGDSDFTVGA